jgi:hypothetical protein
VASETLDFERAAAVHRRVEKVSDALRGLPDLARPIEDLNAVILQRAAEKSTVAVFVVRSGRIDEPRMLRFAELASEPRSVERIFREWLEAGGGSDNARDGDSTDANDHRSDGASDGGSEVVSNDARVPPVAATGSAAHGYRELEDQLSLLARWFYGKPRKGEIFFREGAARTQASAPQESLLGPILSDTARRTSEWPYRRILRTCSRLLAPPESKPADGPEHGKR